MQIKMNKNKVIEAAEKVKEKLFVFVDEESKRREKLKEVLETLDFGSVQYQATIQCLSAFGYGGCIHSGKIFKVNNIIKACDLSESNTVIITDEEIQLLEL